MKNLLFLLTIVVFSAGCKKEEVFINGFSPNAAKRAQNILIEAGLNPKSIEDITYVRFINDSINVKYVGGVKGDAAWFAVFDSNGSEVESYAFQNFGSPKFCSFPHRFDMFGNILFLTVSRENETSQFNESISIHLSYYCKSPILYVINRENKEIVHKIESEGGECAFLNIPNNFGYVVMQREDLQNNSYYKMYFLDLSGRVKWEREISREENDLMMPARGTFINEETVIMYSNVDSHHYRAINLRDYELKFTINKEDLQMTGDLNYLPNISYRDEKWVMDSGKLFFVFSEFENRKIVDDPVTGAHHFDNILVGRYAYQVDPENGFILSFSKIN